MSPRTRRILPFVISGLVALVLVGRCALGSDDDTLGEDSDGLGESRRFSGFSADNHPIDQKGRRMQLGSVQGTVFDAFAREPVPFVDVIFLTRGMESTATSDEQGRYSIELPTGQYRTRAIGDGWFGLSQPRVKVLGSAQVATYDIEVTRLVTLEGRVVDQHGNGVADAEVTFNSRVAARRVASSAIEPEGTGISASDGHFSMRIVAGDVILDAVADVGRGRLVLRHVGPTDVHKELEIVLDPGVRLSGRVFDPDGRPFAGARVHVSSSSHKNRLSEHTTLTTNDDGEFTIERVVSGRVVLEARAEGYAPSAPKVMILAANATQNGVELTLQQSLALGGLVLDAEGQELEGAQIIARRPGSRSPPRSEHSDSDGRFSVPGLGPAPYELIVRKGGYAPVFLKGMTPPNEDIEVTLIATGRIAGTITANGRPVTDFRMRIELWTPASGGRARPGSLAGNRFLGDSGKFATSSLDAGTYDILVTAPGFAPKRKKGVVVPAAGVGEGSLSLQAAGGVRGTVTSAQTGTPVAGAKVTMASGYAGTPVHTNDRGQYALADVAPGRRTVTVSHRDYVTRNVSGLNVTAGSSESVDVRLTPSNGDRAGGIELTGIGAVLAKHDGRLLVASILKDGPADQAGLLRTDRITSIDGDDTQQMTRTDAVEAVRGPVGTTVVLGIERGSDRFSISVVRGNVRYPGTPTGRAQKFHPTQKR